MFKRLMDALFVLRFGIFSETVQKRLAKRIRRPVGKELEWAKRRAQELKQ